jgi:hypothetical protein
MTFTIPYPFLRTILAHLCQRPYYVAVGTAGLSALPGDIELLARSYRFVHEGAPRRHEDAPSPSFEMGFVPFTLNRPDVWQAVALASRMEGDLPPAPTCSIMLGSGEDVGRFTGIVAVRDQIAPVQAMKVVGTRMRRLEAVDFPRRGPGAMLPEDAERWSRLIGALGGADVWERLRALEFCIIGAGRTGSLVATTLARGGVRSLTLVDPDVLEWHNLDAMDAVTAHDLGRLKVEAIAEHLQRDLPHIRITAFPRSLMTVAARTRVKSADVLICCVDDDAARLVAAALASCYLKPLLDLGTGIFHDGPPTSLTPSPNRPIAASSRSLGADIRLILPGDGCLLCWGGVADARGALARWHTGVLRPRWDEERAGSLRSLNALAAHLGIRLLEDLVAGGLDHSVWLRFETDDQGSPSLRQLPSLRRPNCRLCSLLGVGDVLRHQP